MINVFEPQTGVEELSKLASVLKSKWLWPGKATEAFKAAFADLQNVDTEALIPVSSCTDGLFLVFQALYESGKMHNAFGFERRVIMPSIHFVGAANAVRSAGFDISFCDVDEYSLNPTLDNIIAKYDRSTYAVLLLHYGGAPCEEITKIADWCHEKRLYLIEDSACSLLSKKGDVCCGTFGDIGLWSFDPMKLISCGDGGMIYVRDEHLYQVISELAFFGLTSRSGLSNTSGKCWWEFDVKQMGRYSALTDVDSAILLSQIERLPDMIPVRLMTDMFYRTVLKGVGDIQLPPEQGQDCRNSFYFFWIQTDHRDDLAVFLRRNNIYTTFRYQPLHHLPIYNQIKENLPRADRAAQRTLLLPLHAGLTPDNLAYIQDKVVEFYDKLG